MAKISNATKVLSVFLKYRRKELSWSQLLRETDLPKSSLKYALDKMLERGIITKVQKNGDTYYRLSEIDDDTMKAFLSSSQFLELISDLLKKPTTKYHYVLRESISSYFLDVFVDALFGTYCLLRIERARDPLLLDIKRILYKARAEFEYFFYTIFEKAVKALMDIIFKTSENLIAALYLIGIMNMDDELTFTFMNRRYLEKFLDEKAREILHSFLTNGPSDKAVNEVSEILKGIIADTFGVFKEIDEIVEIQRNYSDEIDEKYKLALESRILSSDDPKAIIVVYRRGIFYIDKKNLKTSGKKILHFEDHAKLGSIKFNKYVLEDLLIRIHKLLRLKASKTFRR